MVLTARLARRLSIMLVTALMTSGGVIAAREAQAAELSVTVQGQGFGHGRGMGQWGAYGYAVDRGWTHGQILDHYYGGTRAAGDAGNPLVTVELVALRGRDTILTGSDLAVNGVHTGAPALLVRRVGASAFQTLVGPGCAGPWVLWGAPIARADVGSTEFQVCEAGQVRGYRGTLSVVEAGGRSATVNTLPVDSYLQGVVPQESPASWASAGGGRGMNALYAQAVAARSYALASSWSAYAQTCDTTACQVYSGAYTKPFGGATRWLEDSRTNAAVAGTTGGVRRWPDGRVVRTEFSASTGGWTSGGEVPAVQDDGDATASNPHRAWEATFTLSQLATRLGTPPIESWAVTARTGLGSNGGRVLSLAVDTSGGRISFTGAQARSRLGLKSDWFSVPVIPRMASDEARALATGMYVDMLGREPDAGGLADWTARLVAGESPRAVADAFSTSPERLQRIVQETYISALRRLPDPSGTETFVGYLARGGTLTELHVGLYASPESVQALGQGNLDDWLGGVYSGVLGRPAGASDLAFWSPRVPALGRAEVVRQISVSEEARSRRLTLYFLALLQRLPDDSARASFMPPLIGRGDFDVPAAIASSPEYWHGAQARFG